MRVSDDVVACAACGIKYAFCLHESSLIHDTKELMESWQIAMQFAEMNLLCTQPDTSDVDNWTQAVYATGHKQSERS